MLFSFRFLKRNSPILTDEEDAMAWKFNSNGVYSVHSLYAIVNFGGVTPCFVPAVWKLYVPPRIHIFLWLLSHNKPLTWNNLCKRQYVGDMTCLFCDDLESVNHLFFDCVDAKTYLE